MNQWPQGLEPSAKENAAIEHLFRSFAKALGSYPDGTPLTHRHVGRLPFDERMIAGNWGYLEEERNRYMRPPVPSGAR